ncbi:MAG: TVP38/TMEM64 family protein [Candidatus Dependentiae bacterium]
MKLFRKKRYAYVFATLVLCIFLILKFDVHFFSLMLLKKHAFDLQLYTQQKYWTVLFCYMLLFIGTTACFIPVTILMTILGGFLFGGIYGAIYATLAGTIGGSLVFLIVRHLLRDWVYEHYAKQFERFSKAFQKHGARYLLSLQISPITPTFFINLFMGLTNISLWTYMWTAFVGMLPGAFIYALAGQKIQGITQLDDVMPPIVFVLLFILSILVMVPMVIRKLISSES